MSSELEYDLYRDGDCLVTPERPAREFVPAGTEHKLIIGWDAGANSIVELGGNIHAVFTMPIGNAGVVIGFRSARARQTLPDLVEHGLFFQGLAGVDMVQVIERGRPMTALVVRAVSDTFEIRRVAGTATYWRNSVLLYTSAAPSSGVKVVNACLYASGDNL